MGESSPATRFSFAQASNISFMEELYKQFKKDPQSVDVSWQRFFEGYDFASKNVFSPTADAAGANANAKVESLINAYRRLGHFSSHLNPLDPKPAVSPSLSLEKNGLSEGELKDTFYPANLPDDGGKTLQDIVNLMQDTYCRNIGADFRELNDPEQVVWFQQQMESCRNRPKFSPEIKKRIYQKLAEAEGFERFLQARYLGQKRFSVEGAESLIPMLDALITESAQSGAKEVCFGMAHRGRLNVLANTLNKSFEMILQEFEGSTNYSFDIDGDVKYHMGFVNEVKTQKGESIRLYLSPNPSHLEIVNPVLSGFCFARQNLVEEGDRSRIVPVLMHGDAAFIGQGVVAETFNLAGLPSYTVGGTIHIVINNQLGFTTEPWESRSCSYSSDIAKIVRAPVLHVNADDPEAAVWTIQLAVAYRQKFGKDIVVDLIGYRKHGHNETDEPGFTQPLMYKKISKHPSTLKQYGQTLIRDGILSHAAVEEVSQDYRNVLQKTLESIREPKFQLPEIEVPDSFVKSWSYRKINYDKAFEDCETSLAKSTLEQVGEKILTLPNGFKPNPKINRLFQNRLKMLDGAGAIDWAMAELLAFGSLVNNNISVRLSGQDCCRGTFSSRHGVIVDFETNKRHNIFSSIGRPDVVADIINSPLSEMGVMGFEFGYSVANPDELVLWEAQFGDFANGAQVVIDQFLAASEAKWKQTSGLILLLPHGHEGAGPEHSSGRPERFLQLCGNLNMQVAIPTTAAQYFHILRRQVLRDFRKPLVIMTPKSLLRAPEAASDWKEFSEQSFQDIIDDDSRGIARESVEKLILCTGKIFYELKKVRDAESVENQPLIRIEQLYPFNLGKMEKIFNRYPRIKEVVWAQEEPKNMGAWHFIRDRLQRVLSEGIALTYIGRKNSGTTAEGSKLGHDQEQKRIVFETLGLACSWQPQMD